MPLNGVTYTNLTADGVATPEQQIVWTVSEYAPIHLTFPNNVTSFTDVSCTLCISVRGDYEDGIGVSIARPSGGLLVDTFIQYTTAATYYYLYFVTSASDTTLTISLNAADVAASTRK